MPVISLRYIALLGIVVRLLIAPFFSHPYDAYVLFRVGEEAVAKSPLQVNYFSPLLAYYLVPITVLYRLLPFAHGLIQIPPKLNPYPQFGLPGVTDPVFNMMVKAVPILCDMVLMMVVYDLAITLSKRAKVARRAAAFWFLNPFSIWMTAAWGAYDSIPTLFYLLATRLLLRRRVTSSAICLAVASGWKLYPLFLLPLLLAYVRQTLSRKGVMAFLVPLLSCGSIIFVPAFHQVLGATRFATLEPSGRLGFGLTYWSVLLAVPTSSWIVIPSGVGLLVAFLLASYVLSARIAKALNGTDWLLRSEFIVIAAMLLSLRIVPEPFFIWALPLLAIFASLGRVKTILVYSTSLIGLFYAVTNLPLPFFLLSSYQYVGDLIVGALSLLNISTAEAGAYYPHLTAASASLSAMGILFSACVAFASLELIPRRSRLKLAEALKIT